jgi:uroporphyrin-III C-methyltransferase
MSGVVHLVGAGPGATDLLTVRALRLLQTADLILHDALVSAEILSVCGRGRKIAVGKRAGRPSTDQTVINRLLVRAAHRHETVVRLKAGDPTLFARAHEEIEACRAAGVTVEVTPGITAGFAAAAMLIAPLTERGSARSVVFVTPAKARGADADDAWADAAAAADSIVVYMGKAEAARVRTALIARGLSPALPALICESVSRADAFALGGVLGGLPALAAEAGEGPVLLLVGAAFAEAAARHAPSLAAQARA